MNITSTFSEEDYLILYFDETRPFHPFYHTHEYYEFYIMLDGHITMYIEKEPCILQKGDILLIPPGIKHQGISDHDKNQRFLFTLSQKYVDYFLSLSCDHAYLLTEAKKNHYYCFHTDIISQNAIYSKAWQLIEEVHSNRFGKSSMIHAHISYLFLYLTRTAHEQMNGLPSPSNKCLYEQLRAYIESHIHEELSLEQIASAFFVSKYYISHVFKENFGLSIHQYIIKKRLAIARDAIANRIDMNDACLMSGFKDYSSFYRAFKKEYNQSPMEFKKTYTIKL